MRLKTSKDLSRNVVQQAVSGEARDARHSQTLELDCNVLNAVGFVVFTARGSWIQEVRRAACQNPVHARRSWHVQYGADINRIAIRPRGIDADTMRPPLNETWLMRENWKMTGVKAMT